MSIFALRFFKTDKMITYEQFLTIHNIIWHEIQFSIYANRVYYCGSCARDIVLKRPIRKIEMCVNMVDGQRRLSELIARKLNIFKLDGANSNPTHNSRLSTSTLFLQTALPSLGDVPIIITQTSKSTLNGEMSNYFGDLKTDMINRDFTINAMYIKLDDFKVLGCMINGLSPVHLKKIKCVTDPDLVFNADPIRILRGIRIASELGWGIEPRTWIGMCNASKKLNSIDETRIREELNQILVLPKPSEAFRRMYNCGVLHVLFYELTRLKGLQQGKCHCEDAFDHSLTVLDKTQPNIVNRLSGLLHDIGKPEVFTNNLFNDIHFYDHESHSEEIADMLLHELKYDEPIIAKVKLAVKNHMRFKNVGKSIPSNHSLKKFIDAVGEENIELCLDVIEADNMSHAPEHCIIGQIDKIRPRIDFINEQNKKKLNQIHLPINGADIIKEFKLKKGPIIGQYLELLKEYASINPKMTKEEAFEIIQEEITNSELQTI